MNVNKVVIVGGGSSGWMTASALIKSFPDMEIILIESENIPAIGVGESTYDSFNYFVEYLDVDKKDFFAYTDASIKLGIEFVDFAYLGNEFVYPFGISYIENTRWGMQDWAIKKNIYPETPTNDFAESYFPSAHLIKHNTFNENLDKSLPNFDPRIHTSLHFDAIKFALWLKEKYAIPRGVKNIVADVVDIKTSESLGIEKLYLDNGQSIEADLFIDCTGFKSLLLGGAMGAKFIDYSNELPNNRAIAARVDYIDKEKELTGVTRSTALKNGWVWNIPLFSRFGTGYVYSDRYISYENALEEFKSYLSSDHMYIPRSKDEIESIEFNDIRFKTGIYEQTWIKNVVGIGLSAAFIEPLESNGLFTVHEFIFHLISALDAGNISSWNKKVFNESNHQLYQSFKEFIKIHYLLSKRTDSEYWKDNFNRQHDFDIKYKDHLHSLVFDLYEMKTKTNYMHPDGGFWTGIACIASGMDYNILDRVAISQGQIRLNEKYKETMQIYFDVLESKKETWSNIAKSSPSMRQYLLDKFYS